MKADEIQNDITTLPLAELQRLSPPFANKADEEEAFHYWMNQAFNAKLIATARLTREHYRELGLDLNAPMDKTLVRTIATWVEKTGE